MNAFDKLCKLLNGYIDTIIVSFIDDCKNVRNNRYILKKKEFTEDDYKEIGTSFGKSAKENNIKVQTCFEKRNLCEYGFNMGECLSHELTFKLTGKTYKSWKARREKLCNCVEMVDVGAYNSCPHFCKYCYANYDEKLVTSNVLKHNANSSLLIGEIEVDDKIKERVK